MTRALLLALGLLLAASPVQAGCRDELLHRVNDVRAAHHRRRLPRCRVVNRVAQLRAESMATRHYFGHVSPAGIDAGDLLRARGLGRSWGEAIAWTRYMGVERGVGWVVRWWHDSPPHHAVLMHRWRCAGVGVARRGAAVYYVFVGA
jgi:uncharacterized protein YkwD